MQKHPWTIPPFKYLRAISSKVTDEQLDALYNRRITTRALAAQLGVKESSLSSLFPGKIDSARGVENHKKALIATRREYRRAVAQQVLDQRLSLTAAAKSLNICIRTMSRALLEVKGLSTTQPPAPAPSEPADPSKANS